MLEEEAGVALTWLKQNQMIANPEKFHALLIRKDQTKTSGENFNIQGKMVKSEETVKLLGIQLDYKLNFEQHISELCRKAASQLNVLKRLKKFIGFNEKKILVKVLYIQILITALLYGTSRQLNLCKRLKRFKNALLDSYTMITLARIAIYFRSQRSVLCMFPV